MTEERVGKRLGVWVGVTEGAAVWIRDHQKIVLKFSKKTSGCLSLASLDIVANKWEGWE